MKLIVALVLALAAPIAIEAKPLSKLLADSGVSPQDFDLMGATEMKLYTPTLKKTGTRLSWTNPQSGARGTVKLVATRGNCIYLQHFVYLADGPNGARAPIELRPKLCKSADGRWLIAP